MHPRFIIALCVVACSSAPAREVPIRTQPAVIHDAATPPIVVDAPVEVIASVCEPFDPKNPACKTDPRACLNGMADCKCPSPPDVENPACWAVMPCPRVPDRRVRACIRKVPPCSDVPVPDLPDCPPPPFVIGRVISVEVEGGYTIVIIGIGRNQGIGASWKATLLRADSNDPVPGGDVKIRRVDLKRTIGTIRLTDVNMTNLRVRFEVPP